MKTIGKAYLASALVYLAGVAGAQILTTVYNFSALVNHTNSDGAQFASPLLRARDGSLYGTANGGGAYGSGTIFRFNPSSGTFQVVHTFSANPNQTNVDGAFPYGELVQDSDGNFYGTAQGGGAYGNFGTVFRMNTNGEINLLHSFNYSDGENPGAALTPGGGGNFYGAALLGGAHGQGSIFRVDTNGAFESLHDFAPGNVNELGFETNFDGGEPYGTLLSGGDGWLYGTTYYGGTNGSGTIYRFNTNNGAFGVLHTFAAVNADYQNPDGANPSAGLTVFSNGVFWGTAHFGGTNGNGTIFQITTGGVFTVLHTFNIAADGSAPASALVRGRDGNFYGTAEYGTYWSGMMYQFTTNLVLTPLHFFNQLNIVQNNYGDDGGTPAGGVSLGSDGYYYGTTVGYGVNTNGTIFCVIYPGLAIAGLPGKRVLLSWPTNQAGFTLQVTTNLAAPNWLTASPSPATIDDQFVVTNDATVPKSFYRLKK